MNKQELRKRVEAIYAGFTVEDLDNPATAASIELSLANIKTELDNDVE